MDTDKTAFISTLLHFTNSFHEISFLKFFFHSPPETGKLSKVLFPHECKLLFHKETLELQLVWIHKFLRYAKKERKIAHNDWKFLL